jgi:hypothetical protein
MCLTDRHGSLTVRYDAFMPNLQQQLHVLSEQHSVLSGLGEALEERQRLQAETAAVDARITSLVAAGREYGITWHQIGRVLGISKQAAWEKFGKPDPHPIRSLPPSAEE